MSPRVRRALIISLILLAFLFILVGVAVNWLFYLPFCGAVILLGIIFWERRRQEAS